MSAPEKLTTLAVGGPAGGQSLSGEFGMARYLLPVPSGPDITPPLSSVMCAYYKRFTFRVDGADLYFWVPVDWTPSAEEFVRHLAGSYRRIIAGEKT